MPVIFLNLHSDIEKNSKLLYNIRQDNLTKDEDVIVWQNRQKKKKAAFR